MPEVPRNCVPVAKRPAVLKHSCPPHRSEVEDKSTCTFCARADGGNDRSIQVAASSRKSMAKEFLFVIIPLPSIDLAFDDEIRPEFSAIQFRFKTAIPLESDPARNSQV